MKNFYCELLIAYKLTGVQNYRNAAILNTDFMLDANPMGTMRTAAIDLAHPIDINHEVSETGSMIEPVPGIKIYRIPGGGIYLELRDEPGDQPIWQALSILSVTSRILCPGLDGAGKYIRV